MVRGIGVAVCERPCIPVSTEENPLTIIRLEISDDISEFQKGINSSDFVLEGLEACPVRIFTEFLFEIVEGSAMCW